MGDAVTVAYLHPGHVTASFHTSLLNLVAYDLGHCQRVARGGYLSSWCASGRLVEGRNQLAATFLEQGHDWLWMVDTDMGFAPDTIDRLVASAHPRRRPVVGGLAFGQYQVDVDEIGAPRFEPFPTLYRWYEDDQRAGFTRIDDYEPGEVVEVAGTGAACLLIHRSVLAEIRERWGPVWFTQIPHPKAGVISEDLSFCIRVAAIDRPVHVDTSVKTSHEKNVFLTEAHYLQQRREETASV